MPNSRPLPPVRRVLVAAFAALGLLAPASASATPALTTSSALSPQLTELAQPAVRSQSLPAQAEALGLPGEGAGTLIRQGNRVIVEARFESGAIAALDAVRAVGASVVDSSHRYQTLVLSIPPARLPELAAVPGVLAVTPALKPRVSSTAAGSGGAPIASNGLCEGGSVVTEGLEQLNVAAARGAFGARGAGKTIAVISNSFNSATLGGSGAPIVATAHDDERSNDLPGPASTCSGQQVPVNVIAEEAAGQPASAYTDEGRAMLQVIHDLAPHARLAFATGTPSEISYAKNIERLAAPVSAGGAGADVIVDDLSYQTEPFFQDGPVAVAIRKVTEKGVLYFTAAGNDNLFDADGNEIASWEAPAFRGSSSCNAKVAALLDEELAGEGKGPYEPDCMDFDPTAGTDTEFGITVEPNSPLSLSLQWAEPWFGVESAFFAFLLAGSGAEEEVITGGGSNALGTTPFIPLSWTNESDSEQEVRLVIARCSGDCNPEASSTNDPRIKLAILEDGYGVAATEYPESSGGDVVGPVIYGHAGAVEATTVAAVNYQEPSSAPKRPEPYSSRGPVTHYFGPVEGTDPAPALLTPETIQKPDITATDCASTTFFEVFIDGGWHFCGTSQAAEHAATVAALMQQTEPFATPAEIRSGIESTATKFTEVDSPDAVGAGMVNALAAITAVGGSPVHDPPSTVVPSLEEEAAAPGPAARITSGPPALGNQTRPTFEFAAAGAAGFSCQVDGRPSRACSSPYAVPFALADGPHRFLVTATDARGRSGPAAAYAFTVDTEAPRARIAQRPKAIVKTRKRSAVVRFKLAASQPGVSYYCRIDNGKRRTCPPRFKRRFGLGRHVVRVRALDAAGNLSQRDAVIRFRVVQVRVR